MRLARKIALFSPAFAIALGGGIECGTSSGGSSPSLDASAAGNDAGNTVDGNNVLVPSDAGPPPVFDAAQAPSSLPECAAQRVVTLIGGNGGLAWFTLVWPVPDVIENYQPSYAYDNPALAAAVIDASSPHPLYARITGSAAVLTGTGTQPQPTAFVAGVNQTHTTTPTQTVVNGVDVIAVGAAAQNALHPFRAVITLGNSTYTAGDAGPPPLSAINSNDAITSLADAGLPSATVTALTPDPAVLATWYGTTATPTTVLANVATGLFFAANAFRLGVASTITIQVFDDDPHGAFADGDATTTGNALTSILQHFYAMLAQYEEPSCSHNRYTLSLADNVALVVFGDTPNNSYESAGWPAGSPGNANYIYMRSNGYLIPGWFGQIANMAKTDFDPTTGALSATATVQDDESAADLAMLYAITRGNTALVSGVSPAPYQGSLASPLP